MKQPTIRSTVRDAIGKLRPTELGLTQHTYQQFNATLPSSVTREKILEDGFFSLVSKRLNYGDEIRCISCDGTWMSRLFVNYAEPLTSVIKVIELEYYELEPAQIENISARYEPFLAGPKKFCVRDTESGETIQENLPNRTAAEKFINDLVKARAA